MGLVQFFDRSKKMMICSPYGEMSEATKKV